VYTINTSIHRKRKEADAMKRIEHEPVEMPPKTTRKHGPGDTVYIYETLRAYRNDKGKPTSDEAAIGKLASDGIRLIPNARYFELHPRQNPPPPRASSAVSFGAAAAMMRLADDIGVLKLLAKSLPALDGLVALAAVYMVLEGNVMYHIEDHCADSWVAPGATLDSGRASELFSAITFAQRMDFAKRWVAHISEQDYIAYDVTSLSTYSGGIEDAEWGHNRDGEDLCQINLGMFLGEGTRLPVHYCTYQGSVLDKVHLAPMMREAKAVGIGSVRFVFDRGFVSAANIDSVASEHLSFITALPTSLLVYKSLITAAAPVIHSSRNQLEGQGLYALSMPCRIGTTELCAHVFFSCAKAADEEAILYARVSKMEGELGKLAASKRLPRRYGDYFDIDSTTADVAFRRDFDKIDAKLVHKGYFVLATNDDRLDAAGCLEDYRAKDIIEKAFSGMKNHIDFKRMRTHGTATTDGKLFCGFIALILRSALAARLSASKDTRKMPVTVALRELKKLKRITYSDGTVSHTAITRTQSMVLKAIGIEPDDLLAMP
jgi:hypothetical protein